MLTYRIRKRRFRLLEEAKLSFPAEAVVRFHLLPEQPFGDSPTGGRTAVRAVAALAQFDPHTGRHTIESGKPLEPLALEVSANETHSVNLQGRVLELRGPFESQEKIARVVESTYFGFPWLLAVPFADPPYVERVDGEIGGIGFSWELAEWGMSFETTTQDEQAAAVVEAYRRLQLLHPPERRRLLAALNYLHVAARLERVAQQPGEFLAEVLLNLAKVLEVLFPGAKSIDSAREGLGALGYSASEIQSRFVPVLAIRNQIDVGHVLLSVFTRDQLSVLHSYAESAERHFRDLLERVLTAIEAGTWDVPAYDDEGPRPEALNVIERMSEALGDGSV